MIEVEDKEIKTPYNETADYSEDFIELYRREPSAISKWGIVTIFFSTFILISLTTIIKYPDIVSGQAKIISNNSPSTIVTRSSGLVEVFIDNKSFVKRGDILVYIKNSTTFESYKVLKSMLENEVLLNNEIELQLGELQEYYNNYLLELENYEQFLRLSEQQSTTSRYLDELNNLQQSVTSQQKKINLYKEELVLLEKDFNRDKTLFSKGVISKKEIEDKEKEFISANRIVEDMNLDLIQLKIKIRELNNLNDVLLINSSEKIDIQNKKLSNSLKILEEKVKEWEENFLSVSPIDGYANYLTSNLQNNNYIEQGNLLMSIVPKNQGKLKMIIEIPASMSGKVKVDQKVHLYLDGYPSEEYGIIRSKITKLSSIPNQESKYILEAELSNKLVTSYNTPIEFTPNLSGTAEIVTNDITLFDRIFNKFNKIRDKY